MRLHSTSLYILFLIIVIQASVRSVMAISQYSDMMNTCGGETPYFCVHNLMCYGHDQYCHKDEVKIQECLPVHDAFNWCKNNALNVSALPDPQCARACAYRYNTTLIPTPVDQLGCGGDNSVIGYQIACYFLIVIAVVLVIGNVVQHVRNSRLLDVRVKKELESLLEDNGRCLNKWQQKEPANMDKMIDKKKERHLSWEGEPLAEESSEATVFEMTELREKGLGDIGVSERRTDRGDESAGSPISDPTSASGLGDDSGYDSRGPNVGGDNRTTPNRGLNPTYPGSDQLGQSSSAVHFGPPCRTPHPMPISDQSDGEICTSFSRSRPVYSDPVFH